MNCVRVFTATFEISLGIWRPCDNRSIGTAFAAPTNGSARPAVFECFHFRHVGAATISLVKSIANRAPNDAANNRARHHRSRTASSSGTNKTSGNRTGCDTGSRLGSRLTGTARKDQRNDAKGGDPPDHDGLHACHLLLLRRGDLVESRMRVDNVLM